MAKTPRIIHQTWKTSEVPAHLRGYAESCRAVHGVGEAEGYSYQLWTDADIDELVSSRYPEYYDAFLGFAAHIERVDFARYAMMHAVGGVYLDLDIECFRSVDDLVRLNRVVLSDEPVEHREKLYGGAEHVPCNAMLIGPPGDDFWTRLMAFVVETYDPARDPVTNTGPVAFTRFMRRHPDAFAGVLILSPCAFFAQVGTPTGLSCPRFGNASRECSGACGSAYAVHHWQNSWCKPDPGDARRPPPVRCVAVGATLAMFAALLAAAVAISATRLRDK